VCRWKKKGVLIATVSNAGSLLRRHLSAAKRDSNDKEMNTFFRFFFPLPSTENLFHIYIDLAVLAISFYIVEISSF